MVEQKGLHTYDFARGPFGTLELANADWTVDDVTDKNGRAETVPVEAGLLDQLDSLAKKMGTTRESLVVRGIKAVLAAAGKI